MLDETFEALSSKAHAEVLGRPQKMAQMLGGRTFPCTHLQEQGLEAREGGANAEVDLLARIHRSAGRFVRRPQICHRCSRTSVFAINIGKKLLIGVTQR